MSKPQLGNYRVSMRDLEMSIDAAYYVHEEDFTVFKEDNGGIVGSFQNREILGIWRERPED